MLRANPFYKFFKFKKNISHEIVRYKSNDQFDLQDQINNKIIEIDQKISENSKALIQAQIVKLKYKVSNPNNLLNKIGRNVYKTRLEESINWHQKQIKELYFSRKELEINLEKIKGTFWLYRLKGFLKIVLICFFILLNLFIFLSGLMIIVYLLPLIILILLVYLIFTKKP